MARPRTPTALLELNGSFKAHPERKKARANEPVPTGELGNPPKHLTKEQKKVWKELAEMAAPGVLTNSDRWSVELVVRLVTKMRDGSLKAQEASILTTLFGKLGLTPADRSKVSVIPQPKQKEDSWADFVNDDNVCSDSRKVC